MVAAQHSRLRTDDILILIGLFFFLVGLSLNWTFRLSAKFCIRHKISLKHFLWNFAFLYQTPDSIGINLSSERKENLRSNFSACSFELQESLELFSCVLVHFWFQTAFFSTFNIFHSKIIMILLLYLVFHSLPWQSFEPSLWQFYFIRLKFTLIESMHLFKILNLGLRCCRSTYFLLEFPKTENHSRLLVWCDEGYPTVSCTNSKPIAVSFFVLIKLLISERRFKQDQTQWR